MLFNVIYVRLGRVTSRIPSDGTNMKVSFFMKKTDDRWSLLAYLSISFLQWGRQYLWLQWQRQRVSACDKAKMSIWKRELGWLVGVGGIEDPHLWFGSILGCEIEVGRNDFGPDCFIEFRRQRYRSGATKYRISIQIPKSRFFCPENIPENLGVFQKWGKTLHKYSPTVHLTEHKLCMTGENDNCIGSVSILISILFLIDEL